MKKTLISLSLIGFLAATLLVPVVALGAGSPDGCTIRAGGVGAEECSGITTCTFNDNTACGMCCLLSTIYNVTDWIFVILVALTTVFVILGALKILMAKDSSEEVAKGRQYIMYAALGLLVAFLAKAVPQIVKVASGFQ
ncbi:MAG: hypothetical protein E4H47_00560 [Parcubacteria group bacterium]|nr:MAG: hypothetical protein E4H47_00560 [Parcubacteria group bacterium]